MLSDIELRPRAPLALFLVAWATGSAFADEVRDIVPDQQIQSQIQRIAKGFSHARRPERLAEAFAELRALLRSPAAGNNTAARDEKLVQQIAYFRAHPPSEPEMLATVAIFRFANFRGNTIVNALAPFIGTSDEKVHKDIVHQLQGVEARRGDRPPDFSYYRSFIIVRRRQGREVEQGLIEHMYRGSPGDALLVMADALLRDDMERPLDAQKPIRWAERVVSTNLWKRQYAFIGRDEVEPDARAQLDFLSKHPQWWARLYAAEIIRQHPEFGTDELVKRLSDDPHALVQKTAKAIRLPKRN